MTRDRQPCVYILASGRHGTLYIGVTSDLPARLYQHREGLIPGFTSRYGVRRLVWFERHEIMEAAIVREKQLKKWRRAWKLVLVEERNPFWDDLAVTVLGFEPLFKPVLSSFPCKRESTVTEQGSGVSTSMASRLRGNDGGCFD